MSDKVLVYLGPSLPLARAREILPEAIYHPPARQGDIVTDVVNLNPTHILLVDGSFRENLSPWHKELVYALQCVKAIYGAASMGALRASELDWLGMIGVGQIYNWYRDGVTEDDAEVAVSYAELPSGDYKCLTVPLVDIRAGVNAVKDNKAEAFFAAAQKVNYMDRTKQVCEQLWGGPDFPMIPQKAIDTIALLESFRELKPESEPKLKPTPDHLSRFFQALYERDRRIEVSGESIPQQHIDAYVLLHHPEYERICWDSSNHELALMLCDLLLVTVSIEEVERENIRFQQRSGIETPAEFSSYLSANGWSQSEYNRLIIQNARIRKLQHSNTVAKMYRRNSQQIIDYLRTHQAFDYWAAQAVTAEKKIKESGIDDWLSVNLEQGAFEILTEHFEREGLELHCNPEEYLLDTGFSNSIELGVALERLNAAKEN
jgi:hypothetical protein